MKPLQWRQQLNNLTTSKASHNSQLWHITKESITRHIYNLNYNQDFDIVFNSFGYRQPKVTWISFVPLITNRTVQSGIYPLIIMDELGECGYMAVGVAWNQFARKLSFDNPIEKITRIKNKLNKLFPEYYNIKAELQATTKLTQGLEYCLLISYQFTITHINNIKFEQNLISLLNNFIKNYNNINTAGCFSIL